MRVAGPVLSVLAFLAGAATLAAGEPASPMAAIERAAPEKCLYYFGSPGLPAGNADSANHAEQLLANPEIRRFGEDTKTIIETYFSLFTVTELNGDGQEFGVCLEHSFDLAIDVALTHSFGVFIEWPANAGGDNNPSPALAVILHCGDRADDVRKVAREFADVIRLELADTTDESVKIETKEDDGATTEDDFYLLIDADGFRTEIALRGEFLVWTVDKLKTADLFLRLKGDAAPPKWLAALKDRAASKRIGTVSYFDAAEVGAAFGEQRPYPAVVMLSQIGIDDSFISAIGLNKFIAAGAVGALDEEGVVTREFIDLGGWPAEWPPQKPLSADDLKPIPDNADFAAIGRFDAGWLFRQLLVVLDQTPAAAVIDAAGDGASESDVSTIVAKLEEQLGFRIEDDLLLALGDVWTIHSSPGGGLIPGSGLVATVALRDEQKLAKVQEGFAKFVREKSSADGGSPAAIVVEQFKGIEIRHQKSVGPDIANLAWAVNVDPAWAVVDGRFVVAASLQGMKFHITRAGKQSLAEVPAIAKRLKTGPIGLVYGNTASAARQLIAAYELFGSTLIEPLEDFDVDVKLPQLPDIKTIEPHLLPQIVTVRRSVAGFEVESFATVPQVTLTATTGLLWFAANSVGDPFSGNAEVAPSENKLAEIGQAMAEYHDEFKSFPAAAICDAQGKPLLSWRVKLLPFLGDDAAALYKEFHLDEPWDSEHNKPLLAKMPAAYKNGAAADPENETPYLVPTGEDTMFNGNIPASLRTATDSPDRTILVVKVRPDKAVPWTKPEDTKIDPEHPLASLGTAQNGTYSILAVDGVVHSLAADFDPEILWGLFTRAGGEQDNFPDSGFMLIDE